MTDKRGEPRRRYEAGFKRRLVAETLVEGATVAAVGCRHGLNENLVFNWKKNRRFSGDTEGAARFLPEEINTVSLAPIFAPFECSTPCRFVKKGRYAMKEFHCGTLVPGCDWQTQAEESADVVMRAVEHIRQVHGEVSESTVEAIKERIRDVKKDAA